jgi:cytochrome c biogenesis protein CcmG/thiol:disulfide interchange protein DsbE
VKRPALWIAASIGVVVALFIGVLATRDAAANRVAPSRLVGRPAPEVTGPGLDGAAFRLSSLQGKYVLVNFFATWCVPCVREHPEMVRFAARHEGVGDAAIVSVVYDDERPDVRRFFAERGGDWPVVDAPGAKVDWGVRGVPESFLVAPDGTVLTRIVGGVTASGLERLLAQAKRDRP